MQSEREKLRMKCPTTKNWNFLKKKTTKNSNKKCICSKNLAGENYALTDFIICLNTSGKLFLEQINNLTFFSEILGYCF